eukprot:CAMPEP_0172497474 /NCGR_PEP_ID=MMETSP1066-20121228/100539_1 /TAXON_ID=671091 /ORGANISM="Coscinodiscus wailesii, Strain CCMP2513" /LENGTH=161 /DNA_ID=CAMNT_0013270279 /DNA_START=137 /DNA_END=619 /DNA_ORIENTATION=+
MIWRTIWIVLCTIASTRTSPSAAFTIFPTQSRHRLTSPSRILHATENTAADPPSSLSSSSTPPPPSPEDDDDDDGYEEVELEYLTENDFYNSEWKIGTVWNKNARSQIEETWVRLISREDGTNVAVWGDGAKGTWVVDVPSQFFSISKETFGGWGGKKIWA